MPNEVQFQGNVNVLFIQYGQLVSPGSPVGVIIGVAPGRYGQASVFTEPVTPDFVYGLWEAGHRDGTEVLTVVRAGEGVDMIYPWAANTINSLASNTISEHTYTEDLSELQNQKDDPDSGLED